MAINPRNKGLELVLRRLLLSVLGTVSATVQAGDEAGLRTTGWRVDLSADHHLDPLELSELSRDDAMSRLQPRPGQNLGYLFDEVRVSYSTDVWRLSVLARQRAVVVASEGALDLARMADSSDRPSGDRAWSIGVNYLGFSGAGAEVARQWQPAPGWQADLAVQALVLNRVTERRAQGSASYTASTDQYAADLQSQEANSGLTFPFQQSFAARGGALLASGGLRWSDARLHAGWRWRDAGVLNWRGLPQQALRLSSDIRSVDANGFIAYAPLITGQNSQQRYRRWVAPLNALDAGVSDARWGRWNLGADWWPGFGRPLPRVDWQKSYGEVGLALGWRVHERRAELGLSYGGWRLGAGLDAVSGARSQTLSLSWRSGS